MSSAMEIEQGTVEQQLLAHAERQTAALEQISWFARLLFVIGMVITAVLLIGLAA